MKPEYRPFYGHHWRTVTRPRILRRAGGRFSQDGEYQGAAKCERCGHIDCLHGGRSELDIAHLAVEPGQPGHDDDNNLAALCHPCHRHHDLPAWKKAYRAWLERKYQEYIDALDASRPILQFLRQGVAKAVDEISEGL